MSKTRTHLTGKASGKLKVSYKVHVVQRNRRSRLVEELSSRKSDTDEKPKGTIPRISRLLALAHHVQELLDTGQVRDLAEVARLGRVTRARMTQIMNLLFLAPDIQEHILLLPLTSEGRDLITERGVRQVLAEQSFSQQRQVWASLRHGR